MTSKKLNWIMVALLTSIFLSSLEQTIVSTALPTIVEKLGGLDQISWVFTIYMLTSTTIMPVVGKLSDMYGRKFFLQTGLFVFILGSMFCGMSQSMSQLILSRGIQGLGAGILMSTIFILLFTLMPQERAGKWQGLFMGVFALSSVVGPTVGAVITEHLNWRWNFYINLPLGIFVFIILAITLVETRSSLEKKKVDYLGAITLMLTTLSILLGLKLGGVDYSWGSWQIFGLLSAGLAGLVIFLIIEWKAENPIIPFKIFKDRTVAGTISITFLQGIIMYSTLLYMPLFIQGGLGGNVNDAGNALTPMMISIVIGALICNRLIQKFSWRFNIMLSMFFAGVGAIVFTILPITINIWALRIDMAIIGIGIGILMPLSQTAVVTSVSVQFKGIASSTVTFFRTVGGVLGTAVMATIVNGQLTSSVNRLAATYGFQGEQLELFTNPQLLFHPEGPVPETVLSLMKNSFVEGIHIGFLYIAGIAVLGLIIAIFMGNRKFDPRDLNQMRIKTTSSS